MITDYKLQTLKIKITNEKKAHETKMDNIIKEAERLGYTVDDLLGVDE